MKNEEERKNINTSNNNNNNNDIYNEGLALNCIERVKVDGIAELLQYLNNISNKHFSSPSFRNKLEQFLKYDSIQYTIPLISIIQQNYPSTSLKLLKFLLAQGVNIKALISNSQTFLLFLKSSFTLCTSIEEQIILKNRKEEKAQLKVVKLFIDLSEIELNIQHKSIIIQGALNCRNLKIIKYFLSLNTDEVNRILLDKKALLISLAGIWRHYKYIFDKEQQKSLFKLINYLVEKGVDILHRDENGQTILHLAAKYHSLKIIKYLVSLGIDIHSLDDHLNNSILLSTLMKRLDYLTLNFEYWNNVLKVVKYFISIGVNVEHKNNDGKDVLFYAIEYGNLELIKIIGSSMPSLKSPDPYRYEIQSPLFQKSSVNNILKSFNIEMIKYFDEFPCFAHFFDGENKIITNNFILTHLISFYTIKNKNKNTTKFREFKEVFEFFLNKRNNINSVDLFSQVPIQKNYIYDCAYNDCLSWKFWDYLIDNGINLNHISSRGSILHYLFQDSEILECQDTVKYIMIRSMEINTQIVDHPMTNDLKNEDGFDDFKRKDGEEEEEIGEKLIKWKRGMMEILMKSPKILNLVLPTNPPFPTFKFDEKSSQLVIA